MCHIVFILHVHNLAVISRGGVDGGGVNVKEAAKPPTAVQDCVLTFVNVKPCWTFLWRPQDNFQP